MSFKIFNFVLFVTPFLLTGCLNLKPTDDTTRHYALSPIITSQNNTTAACPNNKANECQKIIGLARILIPEYLDRPKIIYENCQNEYKIAEFHRWMESLEKNISRVIARNLSDLSPNCTIIEAPWKNMGKPEYELNIHILDFKTQLFLSHTLLQVRYSIINIADNQIITGEEVCIKIPLNQECEEYLMIVTSMDQALAQLSKEIALNFK